MAGSKRGKVRKALSPRSHPSTAAPPSQDDDELMDELLAQLDSRDETVQAESAAVIQEIHKTEELDAKPIKRAKDKFKERQARKAAAIASTYSPDDPIATERLAREATEEHASISKTCNLLGVEIHEIDPDGHCLFSAIADQLAVHRIIAPADATYAAIRSVASTYMYQHPDDFIPFLPSIGGEDSAGANESGMMSQQDFEQYCMSVRDTGIWGGEPEIQALCKAFNVPIHVIQGSLPPVVFYNPPGIDKDDIHATNALRISYHRRMYGLGEHYNSLHPKAGIIDSIRNVIQS